MRELMFVSFNLLVLRAKIPHTIENEIEGCHKLILLPFRGHVFT